MNRREAQRARLIEEGIFKVKATGNPALCLVKDCRKACHPNKGGLCSTHAQAKWRARDPKKSAYRALKDHAAARNIPFTICPVYFAGLTDAFAYYDHSAENCGAVLTIDRVFADKGYVEGNLRVITRSENSAKMNRERYLPEHVQAILQRKRDEVKEKFAELERRMMSAAERDGDPF